MASTTIQGENGGLPAPLGEDFRIETIQLPFNEIVEDIQEPSTSSVEVRGSGYSRSSPLCLSAGEEGEDEAQDGSSAREEFLRHRRHLSQSLREKQSEDRNEIVRDIKVLVDSVENGTYNSQDFRSGLRSLKERSTKGFQVVCLILKAKYPQVLKMELPNITINSSDFLGGDNLSNLLNIEPINEPVFNQQQQQLNMMSDQGMGGMEQGVMIQPGMASPMSNASSNISTQQSNAAGGRNSRREPRTNSKDPSRRARFARTADVLSRSGLLDLTMKTAELIRMNQQLDKELLQLKKDTQEFVSDVLSNPGNAHIAAQAAASAAASANLTASIIQAPMAAAAAATGVTANVENHVYMPASSLDLQLLNEIGELDNSGDNNNMNFPGASNSVKRKFLSGDQPETREAVGGADLLMFSPQQKRPRLTA